VTGDREWKDRDYVFNVLDDIRSLYGVQRVREGCARGVDRIVGWPCPSVKLTKKQPEPPAGWASSRGIPVDHFPADWDRYQRAAGPIRNEQMLKGGDPVVYPDMVVAFHPTFQTSKGTKDMVERARKAGIELIFIFPHHDVPRDFNFKQSVLFDKMEES
jgi:hypothetical protein